MSKHAKRDLLGTLERLVGRLTEIQDRLKDYEWSDVVDGVEYCPCCQADRATGHSAWCRLYAPNANLTGKQKPEKEVDYV